MKNPKTWIYTVAAIVAAMVLLSLTGCKTVRTAETTDHRLTERLERIDSLVTRSFVSLQDSSWHERVLSQFQSIKEHSDTSHVITVDTAGNIVRERTIINNYRETVSETSEREREAVRQRIEVLDSAVQAQTALIEKNGLHAPHRAHSGRGGATPHILAAAAPAPWRPAAHPHSRLHRLQGGEVEVLLMKTNNHYEDRTNRR